MAEQEAKNPDCLVKPKVTAQSKGISAYKGIFTSLEEAREADKTICLFPGSDDDTLLNALDGDEEAEWEFKMAFSDLSAKADQLNECIHEQVRHFLNDGFERVFNDCTVALIGNRYRLLGWDFEEEDYFPSHPMTESWPLPKQENGLCGTLKQRSSLLWGSAWVF